MSKPAPYTAGQAVEVLSHDFETPGFPVVWHAATVFSVELRDDKKWDVQVHALKGTWHPQIVGTRGGNRNLRNV